MKYRQDLDGIRGFAAVAIILYHFKIIVTSGGFVALDMFFVLSGFLISKNILENVENNKFTYKSFFVSRFWRLYPTMCATILLTLVSGFIFLNETYLAELAFSATYSLLSISNFYFWNTIDYFNSDALSKPLLHTWSLGLEEQFYLLWPFLLVFSTRKWGKKVSASIIGALGIVSLVFAIQYSDPNTSTSYYLLPGRFFEFVLGFLLVFVSIPTNRMMKELGTLGGFALFFYCFFSFSAKEDYPSYLAIFPCVATMLLIVYGKTSKLAILYNNRIFAWFGRISYSLYLVHYPIYVYVNNYYKNTPPFLMKVFAFVFSVIIAVIINRLVENKYRYMGRAKVNNSRLIPAIILVPLAISSFFLIHAQDVDEKSTRFVMQKHLEERRLLNRTTTCQPRDTNMSRADLNNMIGRCNDLQAPHSAILLGDSNAADLYFHLRKRLAPTNLIQMTAPGCDLMDINKRKYCSKINRYFSEFIEKQDNIDTVYVRQSSKRFIELYDGTGRIEYKEFLVGIREILTKVADKGINVVLIGPGPKFEYVPAILGDDWSDVLAQKDHLEFPVNRLSFKIDLDLQELFKDSKIEYRSVIGAICPTLECSIFNDANELMLMDDVHTTKVGSQIIVDSLFSQDEVRHKRYSH